MSFVAFASPLDGDFRARAGQLTIEVVRDTEARLTALAERAGLPPPRCIHHALHDADDALRAFAPEWSALRVGLTSVATPAALEARLCQHAIAAWVAGLAPPVATHVPAGAGPLCIGGIVVMAEAHELRVDGAALSLIDRRDGRELRISLCRRDGGATLPSRDGSRDAIWLAGRFGAVFTDGAALDHWGVGDPQLKPTRDREPNRRVLEEAAGLMQEHVPHFYEWVGLLLREVLPQPEVAGGNTSQSYPTWFGHIHLSLSTVARTIKMLLHECSHQYFHLARRFARLAKPDAPEAYSVLKSTHRPLEKILLGYHAFANALIAMTELRDGRAPLPRAELDCEIEGLAHLVAELDGALQPLWEPYLEDAGKALYLPLRRRVQALGLGAVTASA